MKIRDLIYELEKFDEDAEVVIGMIQNYGSNFAMNICDNNIEEYNIRGWYGGNFKAVVLTQGNQIGVVNYEDDEDDWDEEE